MAKEQELSTRTRRDILSSVKKVVVGVGAIAGAGVAGNWYGSDQERQIFLPPGEGRLSPELRDELETAGYFIYEPKGETVASMRNTGLVIPSFQLLTIPEGQPDPETVPSEHKWIAFKPGKFYLESKEGATPRELGSLVSSQSSTVRR